LVFLFCCCFLLCPFDSSTPPPFLSVLSNAVKFTHKGQVTIDCTAVPIQPLQKSISSSRLIDGRTIKFENIKEIGGSSTTSHNSSPFSSSSPNSSRSSPYSSSPALFSRSLTSSSSSSSTESVQWFEIEFRVTDSGIGIDKNQHHHLFKPFSQIQQKQKQESQQTSSSAGFGSHWRPGAAYHRIYGGTGLGLAVCKMLVELMNGEISVESESNRGSTFSFKIRCKGLIPTSSSTNSSLILSSSLSSSSNSPQPALAYTLGVQRQLVLANQPLLIIQENLTISSRLADICRYWGIQVTCDSDINSIERRRLLQPENKFSVTLVDYKLLLSKQQPVPMSLEEKKFLHRQPALDRSFSNPIHLDTEKIHRLWSLSDWLGSIILMVPLVQKRKMIESIRMQNPKAIHTTIACPIKLQYLYSAIIDAVGKGDQEHTDTHKRKWKTEGHKQNEMEKQNSVGNENGMEIENNSENRRPVVRKSSTSNVNSTPLLPTAPSLHASSSASSSSFSSSSSSVSTVIIEKKTDIHSLTSPVSLPAAPVTLRSQSSKVPASVSVSVSGSISSSNSRGSLDSFSLQRRLLIAEDNTTNQKLIVRMLQRLGYELHMIETVENGQQAVERIKTHNRKKQQHVEQTTASGVVDVEMNVEADPNQSTSQAHTTETGTTSSIIAAVGYRDRVFTSANTISGSGSSSGSNANPASDSNFNHNLNFNPSLDPNPDLNPDLNPFHSSHYDIVLMDLQMPVPDQSSNTKHCALERKIEQQQCMPRVQSENWKFPHTQQSHVSLPKNTFSFDLSHFFRFVLNFLFSRFLLFLFHFGFDVYDFR